MKYQSEAQQPGPIEQWAEANYAGKKVGMNPQVRSPAMEKIIAALDNETGRVETLAECLSARLQCVARSEPPQPNRGEKVTEMLPPHLDAIRKQTSRLSYAGDMLESLLDRLEV